MTELRDRGVTRDTLPGCEADLIRISAQADRMACAERDVLFRVMLQVGRRMANEGLVWNPTLDHLSARVRRLHSTQALVTAADYARMQEHIGRWIGAHSADWLEVRSVFRFRDEKVFRTAVAALPEIGRREVEWITSVAREAAAYRLGWGIISPEGYRALWDFFFSWVRDQGASREPLARAYTFMLSHPQSLASLRPEEFRALIDIAAQPCADDSPATKRDLHRRSLAREIVLSSDSDATCDDLLRIYERLSTEDDASIYPPDIVLHPAAGPRLWNMMRVANPWKTDIQKLLEVNGVSDPGWSDPED